MLPIVRTTLTVLLVLAFALPDAMGQTAAEKVKVKVRISDDKEADARLQPYSIIPSSANYIMMLRSGEFDVRAFGKLTAQIDLYDRTKLTYVRSIEPDLNTTAGGKVMLEDLVRFGGRPLLIGRSKEGPVTMYWQALDPALAKPAKQFQELCKWDLTIKEHRPGLVSAGSAMRTPFRVRIASDSAHMLIQSPEIRTDAKEAIYLLAMVDRDLKPLWSQVVKVSDKARLSEVLDVELDQLGNAYLLVKNNFSSEDLDDGAVNFEVKLVKLGAGGVEQTDIKLDPSTYVLSAMLEPLKNGRIACAGVVGTTENNKAHTLGNFITSFAGGTLQLEKPRILSFGTGTGEEENVELDDAGESGGTKAEQKDKQRLGYATDVIAILPRSNGGWFLVNEMSFSYFASSPQGGGSTRYIHGPVVARAIDKDGKLEWSTDFRRWTSSGSTVLGRVFCAEYNDQLFLFLLDSDEMAERRAAGEKISPKHARDPHSAYVAFDANGGFKVKTVLRTEKDLDFISGWDIVRTATDEYFALGTEKLVSGRFLPVRIEFSKAPVK